MFAEGITPHPRHISAELEHLDLPLNPIESLAINDPELVLDVRLLAENEHVLRLLELISDSDVRGFHD